MRRKRCGICIRACPDGTSFCGRRDDRGGLKSQGAYHAILADFLFDKPILHFTKNVRVLSIGSWGCNLRCLGCQNSKLSWTVTGKGLRGRELSPTQVVDLAREQGCRGIAFTYNEPGVLLESVESVAREAGSAGLFNILVTNSTLTRDSVRRIAPLMDAVAADIKSMEDEFYVRYCGAEGIRRPAEKILDCIRTFHEAGRHVEVRTNLIPGANDQKDNLRAIARWIRMEMGPEVPWHLTRFFPAHKLSHLIPTPAKTLRAAREIGLKEGLKHVHAFSSKGCDCAREESLIGGCSCCH
jgi:pyruvate formate lyase activating enzyme